ncbi:MAG: hypothetical protein AAB551_00085 [Patescibacteria group bacterium]
MDSFENLTSSLPDISTFEGDGRMPVHEIYRRLVTFAERYHTQWNGDVVHHQEITGGEFDAFSPPLSLPIVSLRSHVGGQALWVIAGIHGEEPAGPNAVARNLKIFSNLVDRGLPVVLLPLANPAGYFRGWRYQNVRRASKTESGLSVGDSEHYLPGIHDRTRPRIPQPSSDAAGAFTAYVLSLLDRYPPRVVIDLHEDEYIPGIDGTRGGGPNRKRNGLPYLYSQGHLGRRDPVAQAILRIFRDHGIPYRMHGRTRFDGEKIHHGLVVDPNDGSIDNLLVAPEIIVAGQHVQKPVALSSVVVETPTSLPLRRRIEVHASILKALPELWNLSFFS